MRGKHHIVIESDTLKYEFEIKRNITVIQGDSATGKTTLVELLRLYSRQGKRSGVRVEADVSCTVYGGDTVQWQMFLDMVHDSIVFIDEDYSFVFSKEFSSLVKRSSNYFVIITRRPLKNLPYSIQEIYGIRTSGKFHFPDQVYHEFYPLFKEKDVRQISDKMILLLEDRESGFQFYQAACTGMECITAEGNSNVFPKLLELKGNREILVIADGAAFGAYIDAVTKTAAEEKHVGLYFPESFEWLILQSDILENASIREILQHPEDYIESSRYFSWEQFFTELLETRTQDQGYKHYQKGQLSLFYTNRKAVGRILGVMPKELQQMLQPDD